MTDKNIKKVSAANFAFNSMKDYGREVIANRALPRIEDGLKPVQRMGIWAAHQGNIYNFIKSAKVIGDTIGDFHPHGDQACYESLVNLVNERYSYFEGRGNFGSISANAASMRYTELKLSKFSTKFSLKKEDLESVPYEPSYDGRKEQPKYLPTVMPSILLNGSEGIAVGITTKIPKHNINEIAEAYICYLETNDIEKSIDKIIGPDYGKCSLLSPRADIINVYNTGEGCLEYVADYELTKNKKGKTEVKITGYPPDFKLDAFLDKMASLADEKIIDEVRNDTSANNGDMIFLLVNDENVFKDKVLPAIKTKLHYKMNILVDENEELIPKMCNLKTIFDLWTQTRKNILSTTNTKKIKKLEEDIAIASFKKKVLEKGKEVLKIILTSENPADLIAETLACSNKEAMEVLSYKIDFFKKGSIEKIDKNIIDMRDEIDKIRKIDVINFIKIEIKNFISDIKKDKPALLTRLTKVL